jgi:hypothetical protein
MHLEMQIGWNAFESKGKRKATGGNTHTEYTQKG